jgi:hypothetical protein
MNDINIVHHSLLGEEITVQCTRSGEGLGNTATVRVPELGVSFASRLIYQ